MARRTKPDPDPYAEVYHFADYRDRLKKVGALDGLTPADAAKVAKQLDTLAYKYKFLPDTAGLTDKRHIEQLYNCSMNSRYLADGENWDDPQAVGRAFSLAKSALTPTTPQQPQHFPYWADRPSTILDVAPPLKEEA
jgi:hypothetical protein